MDNTQIIGDLVGLLQEALDSVDNSVYYEITDYLDSIQDELEARRIKCTLL